MRYIVVVAWEINFIEEVLEWFEQLDPETTQLVGAALDRLEERGPSLGRPLVDTVKGSELKNLKELRPGSVGDTEIRVLFIFDPSRQAVLLVGGDKSGAWSEWYDENIPIAEDRYRKWLAGEYDD